MRLQAVIVEDCSADAELLVRELHRAGFDLAYRQVETAEEFLANLSPAPDIILADYHLPRFGALEALRLVQEHHIEIPVIVVSGSIGDEAAVEAMRKGAADYLLKDRLARLGPAVHQALEKQALLVQRRRASRHLAIEHAVSRALIDAASLDEATQGILRALCDTLGWEWAAIWLVDERADILRYLSSWHALSMPDTEFERCTRHMTFRRGMGFPGRVWANEAPSLIRDFTHDANFPRASAAHAAGLRSGIAFPIKAGGRVSGVVELFSRTGREQENDLFDLLATTGSWIGQQIERKRAETALRQSEEQFRQLAEHIREVFWMADGAQSRILYVSPGYELIWGRPREDVYASSQAWTETIDPDDRDRVLHARLVHAATGTYEQEYRILRPDGTVRWIRDRAYPVKDAAGTVSRIVGFAEDVTERKNLERQLQQAQKMEAIGQLAGGIAHDFNNLLTVIIGYADAMMLAAADPEQQRSDVEQIAEAGRRAAALTRQLLAFSRRQILAPKLIDLNVVVGSMHKLLQRLMNGSITLNVCRAGHPVRVKADPGQIEQVIMNLAINARDAMDTGGRLSIETAEVELSPEQARGLSLTPGTYASLTVSDTGCGMDEQTMGRIFEPFFTTKEIGKGTGLGLSTVYGIVKQSDGEIDVKSLVGVGTNFTVYLPKAAEESDAVEPSTFSMAPGQQFHETILLVEDDPSVRSFTQRILRSYGYAVLEAANGTQALDICRSHGGPIDLLLTDMVMPGLDGQAIAGELVHCHPKAKVLYTSGHTEPALVPHSIASDHTTYLQKPFTAQLLLEKIRGLLTKAV